MLLDMLSTDMQVSYNVKLAHRIGLHTSIYITELLNINRKALQKKKITDDGYFSVDRDYVELRTTLEKSEQRDLDNALSNIGVITVSKESKDKISLHIDKLSGLLLDEDENKIETVIKPLLGNKRMTKKEKIIENLKKSIVTTNEELRSAYFDWIDSVYDRNGWMSVASVRDAQRAIDVYTGKDLDMALDILRIGATNGYKDIAWAINSYEQNKVYRTVTYRLNEQTMLRDNTQDKNITFTDEVF